MNIRFENELLECYELDSNSFLINFGERTSNQDINIEEIYSYLLKFKSNVSPQGAYFTITGKMAVAVYFIVGFYLTLWGAQMIKVQLPDQKEYILYHPNLPPAEKKLWLLRQDNVWSCVKNSSPEAVDGKWGEDVLKSLNIPIDFGEKFLNYKRVIFTGSGRVLMYTALGISAALNHQGHEFELRTPVIPFALIIKKDGVITEYRSGTRRGLVLGILGDPNSGKSVFSRYFSAMLEKNSPNGFQTWLKDCDKSAPTPDWYFNNSLPESNESQIRMRIKTPWTPELEQKVAQELDCIRTNINLLIADMPGGKHPKDPAERDKAERIPCSTRATMFEKCDYFIILCKNKDDYIYNAWRHALAQYGLANRIIARFNTFLSSESIDHFSMTEVCRNKEGIFESDLCNLDRKIPPQIIIPQMAKASESFRNFLFQLCSAQKNDIGYPSDI